MKCAECGGDLAITYNQHDRYFFFNNKGLLEEDLNWQYSNPDSFDVHCENDKEHDWNDGGSEEAYAYEYKLMKLVREKFF